MSETNEFQQRIARVESLVRELESLADPNLQQTARELVQSLMEMHGAGLKRVVEISSTAGEPGIPSMRALANDPLVSSLLVLYGLHPDDLETRVKRGLDTIAPFIRSRGAHLEGITVIGGSVRIRIIGAGIETFESAVRHALIETAADANEVIIEGGPVDRASGFVPLASLLAR